jgi:hypothetical protein
MFDQIAPLLLLANKACPAPPPPPPPGHQYGHREAVKDNLYISLCSLHIGHRIRKDDLLTCLNVCVCVCAWT